MTTNDLPSLIAIDAELGRRSLREYCKLAWHIVEPGTPLMWGWHLDAICEHLEAVSAGQIRNLLINMPPRHMKSLAVSVFWPTFEWINRPECRWLFSSYALSLSVRDSLKCRRVIESPWFQERWGDRFALTGDQNAKLRFENDKTGYRIATSVDSAATGEGGDRIISDDPHNVREAESDTVRESTITWWRETMSTRGNDPKTVAKVVVMQRVHEKDLSGYILKEEGPDWVHLCLEAEAEQHTTITFPRSGQVITRKQGELLWPERFGAVELATLKRSLGPYGTAGQLQQRPAPAGGGRFKREWFRYYKRTNDLYTLFDGTGNIKKIVRVDDCDRFGMMDPAGTDKEQNDKACYTVMSVWDITPDGDMLKVEHWREQAEIPAVADMGCELSRRFDLPWIGVEKNGLGLGVVQTIRRRGVTVRPIVARGSKEARSETAEIRMAAGMIYFPQEAEWRFELEKELLTFPNGEYADQVDELAHAARYVQRTRGEPTEEETKETPAEPDHPMVAAVADRAVYSEDVAWRQFAGSEDDD